MLNNVVLVGRLIENPTVNEEVEGEESAITLAVQRVFKNEKGVYETDFVPCILWGNISKQTREYCHKGDMVGVKGRLQSINDVLMVVAEKVTFLSSTKDNKEE